MTLEGIAQKLIGEILCDVILLDGKNIMIAILHCAIDYIIRRHYDYYVMVKNVDIIRLCCMAIHKKVCMKF